MNNYIDIRLLEACKFMLLTDIEFNLDDKTYVIPKGFITDLASVPRLFWGILPPHGDYAKAAVIHDFLLSLDCTKAGRVIADSAFLQAMEDLNIHNWTRLIMYYSVRLKSLLSS